MDVFSCINSRHSYRGEFTTNTVAREDLLRILAAAAAAPSGCNRQTTEFMVVDEPQTLNKIREIISMPAIETAPALIFCIINSEIPATDNYEVEDCAAAVQNMLLAITALGYASVWIDGQLRAGDRAKKIGALLGVPSQKTVRVLLPIGVPANPVQGPQKLSLEQRVFWNAYKI